jgi:hypothetical protein
VDRTISNANHYTIHDFSYTNKVASSVDRYAIPNCVNNVD